MATIWKSNLAASFFRCQQTQKAPYKWSRQRPIIEDNIGPCLDPSSSTVTFVSREYFSRIKGLKIIIRQQCNMQQNNGKNKQILFFIFNWLLRLLQSVPPSLSP